MWKCFVCKKNCNTISCLIFHLKQVHKFKTNGEFFCTVCGQIFEKLHRFKKHLNVHVWNPRSEKLQNLQNNKEPSVEIESLTENYVVEHEDIDSDNTLSFLREKINEIEKNSLQFSLQLHDKDNISRQNVSEIQHTIKELLLTPIREAVQEMLKNCFEEKVKDGDKILDEFKRIDKVFDTFDSEYKLRNHLSQKNLASTLTVCSINDDNYTNLLDSEIQPGNKKSEGVLLPIKQQIKFLFEKHNFLDDSLNMIQHNSTDGTLRSFIDGKLWKRKKELYPDKLIIPYFLYSDDFGINNPLGSKSRNQNICNVYYSLPTLSAKNSQLDQVFLGYVLKSNDLKLSSSNNCFDDLINVIYDMEVNGIDIVVNNEKRNVKLILALVLGDNLALNTILNFSKSFTCNKYCRICTVCKDECGELCYELPHTIRNVENYESDVLVRNVSLTGIYEYSNFNNIPSYHVTDNYCVDIMHDLYEGICHYDLSEALLYFINKKFFDLPLLNQRIQSFNYGSIEAAYKPNEIKINDIKRQKFKLSARQMMTFCFIFPLLIGDMVPEDDPVWNFVLIMLDILDSLLCFEISETIINEIRVKIQNHNHMYINLFNKKLKPKFHLLTHYPTCMEQSGPLRLLWNFKFEAKHKQFKAYSNVITSRKNVPLSMAMKYQLKYANFLLNVKDSHEPSYNYYVNDNNIKSKILSYFPNFSIPENISNCEIFQEVKIFGYVYQCGMYVGVKELDMKIYKVVYIVKLNTKDTYFFCENVSVIQYNSHFLSYEVDAGLNTSNKIYNIFSLNNFVGPATHSIKTSFGKEFVRLKKYFKAT